MYTTKKFGNVTFLSLNQISNNYKKNKLNNYDTLYLIPFVFHEFFRNMT